MKKIFYLLFTFLITSNVFAATPIEIRICTPEWEGMTQNGKGLYYDLWNEIFVKKGIKLSVTKDTFKRCENLVKTKSADFDVVPEMYLSDAFYFPKWNSSFDVITVLTRKGLFPNWEKENKVNINDMIGKKISWISGYDFDKSEKAIVPLNESKKPLFVLNEIQETSFAEGKALLMLLQKKIDIVYDYENTIKEAKGKLSSKEQKDFDDNLVIFPSALTGSKLFMGFAKTENGKHFSEMWDKGMDELSKAPGENNLSKLKSIYKKWGNDAY